MNDVKFAIKVNGVITVSNLQSRPLAESVIASLPAEQRAVAEIVLQTEDGKTVLFG